jgi:RNA polymerase sigma-70 factor (ECF subfamily)
MSASLYASHGDWLREWLRRYTRCSHRAADLVQDTFCRLLETDAEPVRNPRSYLSTIARRILIDDIRHREVERAYFAIHAARIGDADYLTPERIVEAAQLLSAVMLLIEALPEKTRHAFMMIRFDGLRYADAASRLGEALWSSAMSAAYAHCYALAYPD